MRIRYLRVEGVHGSFDISLEFFSDYSFLTGINGSGKTTVVKALTALLTPSFVALAHMTYRRIEVGIAEAGHDFRIWSRRNENQVFISIDGVKDELAINVLTPDEHDMYSPGRFRDKEADYYREVLAQNGNHAVLAAFKQFTPPIILGIERRTPEFYGPDERYIRYNVRRRSADPAYGSIDSSIIQAVELAEYSSRRILASEREVTEDLRKQLLLNAFKYEEAKLDRRIALPQRALGNLDDKFKVAHDALVRLGLPAVEIDEQLGGFFKKLRQIYDALGGGNDVTALANSNDKAKNEAFLEWFVNYNQIERFSTMISASDQYNDRIQQIREPIARYLKILNNFFADSHKVVSFDDTGSLKITHTSKADIPIFSLSSGETQILVMITRLCFSPTSQTPSCFIVDEPELSLHVRWQELFVDSVLEASQNLQLILATHSPSIILDRTDHCIDLTR